MCPIVTVAKEMFMDYHKGQLEKYLEGIPALSTKSVKMCNNCNVDFHIHMVRNQNTSISLSLTLLPLLNSHLKKYI